MAADRSTPQPRRNGGSDTAGTGEASVGTAPACRAELLDIAGGDATLAEQLEQSLRHLAGSRGHPLAELADDVLHARIPLRTAATSHAYGHLLADAARDFQAWYDRLSSHDRAALTAHDAAYGIGRNTGDHADPPPGLHS